MRTTRMLKISAFVALIMLVIGYVFQRFSLGSPEDISLGYAIKHALSGLSGAYGALLVADAVREGS